MTTVNNIIKKHQLNKYVFQSESAATFRDYK